MSYSFTDLQMICLFSICFAGGLATGMMIFSDWLGKKGDNQ